ncbi:MAG: hypothetical protein AUH30_12735 [Candidatus Rokubacteria bacterium 13_1_40CM_68_15]|nr:MAG: hypothetical protein AUH30_12735 [Candidatus Rokubacteria bacterium 13_1_40CM_68_15]
MNPRARRRLVVALLVVAVAAGALAGAAAWQGSPASLVARKGRLIAAEVTPAGEDAISTMSQLTLRRSTGRPVTALVRVPRGPGPHPAAVLLGGVNRGRRVAGVRGLDAIARHAVIVSPDYPLPAQRGGWEGWRAITMPFRLRPAAFDTVADILLLLDYLESRQDVAPTRLFLVGSSLGAPAVAIAGGIDTRPAAVVALYGGGRIGALLGHALAHPDQPSPHPPWRAWLLGHALALGVAPLAPERYVAGIAPRPFLMVNGADDSLVPRASVLALYEAARAPKELIWVPSEHVQPDEADLIRRLSGTIVSWLSARGLLPSAS